ncbi:MAG: PEP-CTERM sorting domain-containing protein [Burkholderiales bacterium]|nr:PEP-CTERM sorting domain-containing protein [Burkholderiales bacterium]
MNLSPLGKLGATAVLAFGLVQGASAATQPVMFNLLNMAATVTNVMDVGDTLFVDTLVTTETGALNQSVTFTVGPDVDGFFGSAVWQVSPAASTAPRLVGVNIDLFDSTNTLVTSDVFGGVLGGYAVSSFLADLTPGTYKLVATGTGVRDSSLDISLTFTSAVPEPETYGMLLAGLGILGAVAARRKVLNA